MSIPSPSEYGQDTSYTATVSGDHGTPTGNVTFRADGPSGDSLATAALSGGEATYTASSLHIGEATVYAEFGGDGTYFAGANDTVNITVEKADTTVEILASHDPIDAGQEVTLTANVEGEHASPADGTVTFMIDGAADDVPVNDGQASVIRAFEGGTHEVRAEFSGNDYFHGSDPKTVELFVRHGSAVYVSAGNPGPVAGVELPVTFGVEPDSAGDPGTSPTGDVTVTYAGGSCSATVAEGACTLVPASAGDQQLDAEYGGDSTFAPSSATTSLRAWDLSPSQSEVTVDPGTLRPGETSTITALARDASGDPVPGLGLELDGYMGAADLESDRRQTTGEDGTATWSVTSEYMAHVSGDVVHAHSGFVLDAYEVTFEVDLDGIFDPTPEATATSAPTEPPATPTPEPTATPTPGETPEPTPETPAPSPTPSPTMEPEGPAHDVDEPLPAGTSEVLFTFGSNSDGRGTVGNNPGYGPGEGDEGNLPIQVGDWLRFGPGTPNQEDSQVVGITFLSGPQAQSLGQSAGLQHVALQLEPPLQHDHQPGEEVVKLPATTPPGDGDSDGDGDATPDPTPPADGDADPTPTATPEPEDTPSAPAPPDAGSGLAPVQTGSALVIVLVVLVGATGAVLAPAAVGRR